MSVSLDAPISSLLTNRRRAGALKALGVVSVHDALTYYPFRVTDPTPMRVIRQIRLGEPCAFAASVRNARAVPRMARHCFRF